MEKSTSGKNEKINVGVIDAASAMTTYTDTKEFTLNDGVETISSSV